MHSFREMMFGSRDVFEYLECAKCKCVQIAAIPVSMSKYYPASYHSFAPLAPRNRFRGLGAKLRDRYAVSGRGALGKYLSRRFPPDAALASLSALDLNHATRILDVGCGSGMLLNALGDLGFRSLLGIDPFLAADIDRGSGVRLMRKTIHEVEGEFDVIMFHHSFEHLADPEESLKAARLRLSPRGHCLIRMPIVSSYAWRHYGKDWVQLDAPRHFYIHSIDSVRILADRAGFEVSKLVYDSTAFQFWASEQYALDIPLYDPRSYAVAPRSSIFTGKQIAAFEKRACELNAARLGDQACFYLTKQSVA